MKKLIYTLTFFVVPLGVFAQPAPIQEIVNPDDGKQIVSVIKDMQVLEMLEKTSEFRDCRKMNEYKSGAGQAKRDDAIKKAQVCFSTELTKNDKTKEKLKTLSEALNLQHYGLVQSKNLKDIQNYLADKMYESLTGVNPKDADFKEKMKFKNKKHIDQKTFIEMYRSQLGKNALYEVSRFCFENLRLNTPTPNVTTFSEYWKSYGPGKLKVDDVNDFGSPQFGTNLSSPDDKSTVYKEIFASIQASGAMHPDKMSAFFSAFFLECGKLIVPLCAKYQTKVAKPSLAAPASKVDLGVSSPSAGAAACLAKSRIQNYRKALADVEKVDEEFVKMASSNADFGNLALKGQPIKLFESGKNGNETIDDLTNFTSSDVLEGGYTKDELAKKKAEDCVNKPELAECEGFISEGEDLDKAKHNVEMELTLKREVEMARVKKLNDESKQSLEEYLKENGFFELLKDDRYKNLSEKDLMNAIGESYEAKKLATLEQINKKLGARQVAKGVAPTKKNAEEVTKQASEERSRLAQVVLFNNIITSHLSLKKKDADGNEQSAGRNINVWKREEAALGASRVDPGLFQNLKAGTEGETGLGKDNQIAGFELLDEILGKDKKP
jgi:hypothetical protein